MLGKVGHVGPMEKSSVDADELDERTRYQLKAILQFLQEKDWVGTWLRALGGWLRQVRQMPMWFVPL